MSTVLKESDHPAPRSWVRTLRGVAQLLAASAVFAALCVLPSGLHHLSGLAAVVAALLGF